MRPKFSKPFLFLLVVISCFPVISAINLSQCKNNILQEWTAWNGSGNTSASNTTSYPTPAWAHCSLDPFGVINDSTQNVTLTYNQCKCKCGTGPGDFTWTLFSQNFSTWLLPWIALMFQLPFGSEDRFVNLMSVLLAIGSPALASYSLAITRLNNLWLAEEFAEMSKFPNVDRVPTVLSALQHIPIKLADDLTSVASLVVLPRYDEWWALMVKMSNKTRQWNIPAAMNISWATISVVLTLVDSFADFGNFITVPGDTGYAILAVWFYLLPLVVCWLQLGSQPEANHLRDALAEANIKALEAIPPTKEGLASQIPGHQTRPIDYAKHDVQRSQGDEKRSAPIFNYSRVFIWSRQADFICRLYKNASARADRKITVDGGDWNFKDSEMNRVGSDKQLVEYCLGANLLVGPSAVDELLSRKAAENHVSLPLWAPRVVQRALISALLGLGLQWGTTGAAILIHFETPPKGIGCRSLTFVLYGILSTVVFLLVFLSSILSHCARVRPSSHGRKFLSCMACISRWTGKFLGIISGLGIIAACLMQLSGGYDNCFCSSTIFGGSPNGVVSFLDASSVKASIFYKFWIGGTVMAMISSLLYGAAIYFASPMVT